MLEYTLKNGNILRIKGRKFEIDSDGDGNIMITPLEQKSPFVVGEDYTFDDIVAPAIDPTPAPVIKFDDLPEKKSRKSEKYDRQDMINQAEQALQKHVNKKVKEQADLSKGETKFVEFMNVWRDNFGVEGSEQPDRATLMTSTMNQYSRYILKYVKHTGGLTNSILELPDLDPTVIEDRLHARLLSENIAQVGSILYPAIAELLEYPFELEP